MDKSGLHFFQNVQKVLHSQHFHDFSEGVTGDVPDFLKSVPQKCADFQQNAGNKQTV